MNNSTISPKDDVNNKIIKQVWRIGNKTVVIIDQSIVYKLGIEENTTFVEQEIINDGILMRIRKIDKNLVRLLKQILEEVID